MGTVLVRSAHGHRYQGADHVGVRALVALDEQRPEGTADRGEHDVVDAHVEMPGDRVQVGEPGTADGVAAVSADRAAQRRRRRRYRDRPHQFDQPLGGRGDPPHRPGRVGHRLGDQPYLLGRAENEIAQRLQGQLPRRRRHGRLPPVDDCGTRLRGVVVHRALQVDPADAVGHAVVDLQQHRPPSTGQALDDPALPERPVTVQALRHQPSDQPAQRRVVAGYRKGGAPHVVPDVEVGIVDPHRPAEIERHGAQLLPVPRHQRQLAVDRPDHLVLRRHRALEHGHRRDGHGGMSIFVLGVQERRVQWRQPVRHGDSLSPPGRGR